MHRRQVLSAVGAVAAIGLVGCAGSDTPVAERNGNNSSGTGSGQPTGTTTPTATGTSTPARRIELESREFTVVDRESGQQRDDVRIGYQTEANEVCVEGTIWGSDGCKTARLDAATYDADENRLSVAVATRDRTDDAGVCTQALVEIDYEATFGFSNGTPDETTVSHDGREVASVARGTTAADAE